MASDLSSGCTEVIEIFDEKEEGEISLEDVSSSEEGQLNDGCNTRRRATEQCPSCLSTKHCASWCSMPTRRSHGKSLTKKDAVQEKENCHHTKDSGYSGSKHPASTLQENNNDLIPISSDSDMEIVGLTDSVKQTLAPSQPKTTKTRKSRRKRRSKNSSATVDNAPVLTAANQTAPECSLGPKRDSQILKDNHLPKIHRRESSSPHKITGSSFTRSRIIKSPLRRHRSPFGRPRSPPVLKKSPVRRPRTPARSSPPLSPIRSPNRRQLRGSLSPSNPSVDMHGNVNKLLKKVRSFESHLKAVGTHSTNRNSGKRKGRGPSLKDKLNNMMKINEPGDNLENETTGRSSNEQKMIANVDDEEDLALLRKMALKTKPKGCKKASKEVNEVRKEVRSGNNNAVDDDVEDLELRMIALRSAVLKKHQDRIQRGAILGKMKKHTALDRNSTESPFSQSFLDNIPIPGEDNEEEFKTPPRTPSRVPNENTNPEDMELDSEVELEKEKGAEPYSPTDEISRQITIDSELLGIQPSDVSFITPTSQVTVTSNTSSFQTPESVKIDILQTGASYLPGNENSQNNDLLSSESTCYSNTNVLQSSQSPTSSLYSPSNATEPLGNHFSTPSEDNLPTTPYSPSQPIDTPQIYFSSQDDPFFNSNPSQIPDTPYSPTDTPMYDIELNNPSLLFNAQPFQESDGICKAVDNPQREMDCKKWRKSKPQSTLIKIKLVPNLPIDDDKPSNSNVAETTSLTSELSSSFYPENMVVEKDNLSETSSMKADNGSAFNSSLNSPDGTMITVDELPETDLDGSPLVPVSRVIDAIEIHIPATLNQDVTKIAQEPLYLQGVPDVTKDANKIPTLVNRSLVPASILKSNKNLQQPLPLKKIEAHLEPAFKSAEMQPVQISNETIKTNRLFKPIKLATVMKKPQLKIVTPAAFNCSSNDNSVLEEQRETESGKSVQVTSRIEADNLFQDSQNKVPNKTWEATVATQLENGIRIAQAMKTLPLPILEQQTNAGQDRRKNNNTFVVSDLESWFRGTTKNVSQSSGKKRRRRLSKHKYRERRAKKLAQNDKSIKDAATDTSKAIVNEGTVSTDTYSLHKHISSSNKTSTNHGSAESAQKQINSSDKFKKPEPEKTKDREERRDREEGKDTRSGHKYNKVSNNYKQSDANKLNDRRILMEREQQKITETIEGTERRENSTSHYHSVELGKEEDKNTAKPLQATSNTHGNVRRSDNSSANIAGRESSESCTISTKSVESSTSVSNNYTRVTEDSPSDNTACKKVEANKRRRSSLDEDEEALRAILLASLAKRSKPSDPVNTKSQTSALANLSHTSANTSTESVQGLPDIMGTKVSVNSVYSSSCDSTPPSLGQNHLTLNNSCYKGPNLENLVPVKISDTVIAKNIVPNNANRDQIVPLTVPLRKRSISSTARAPLKKIAKKVPISASTKVVNNAKKYQNTLVQKKLNLQKVAMITNAQKTLSRTNLHNNTLLDGNRPRSMITQPLSDTQRFVINLESDSESENEIETVNRNLDVPSITGRSQQKPVLAIPMSEFEKSVDLFLKDVRKKQETAAAIKPSSTTSNVIQKPVSPVTSVHRKSPVLSTTPLAVRHLPVSLQEEYRRLKQQILEREKLKLHRVLVNNTSPLSPSSKSSGTPPGPLSPASPISSPTMSKLNHNIPSSSQTPMISTANDSSARSVSDQSNVKNTVPNITARVSPVVGRANAPILSVSNLSIQIPNETINVNSNVKKASNSYIPVSNSQARLVTAVKSTQDMVNTKDSKDSVVSVKDQLSLKNVQVQLQQGKTGRRVSLGESPNLSTKTVVPKNKEAEAQEFPAIKTAVDSNRADKNVETSLPSESLLMKSKKSVDTPDTDEKCDNSVDSAASTLIISREGENAENSTLADSSASTVIIPRNEHVDSNCRPESESSQSSELNSPILKSPMSAPKKLKNNKETWAKVRDDVTKELNSIAALPLSEKQSYLATVEQNLVKKRYAILDDLSEISGNLGKLEMEREVQANMASEVKRLQEQLKLAEERLQAQRIRVNKMVPDITATYEKFNSGRRECVKMTRICLGLGCQVIGANYKIPAAGAQLLNNRLKQVAGCTRQLSNKKLSAPANRDGAPSKIDFRSQTSGIENSLNSPSGESTPSTIHENSTEGSIDSGTIASVTITEEPRNSNTEFAVSIETAKTDVTEQETLKLDQTTTAPFAQSVSIDSPQLTSTPNASRESSSVTKHEEYPGTSTSTFVLDSPRAGLSGRKDASERRRFLEPYKSVLSHLKVSRTTDPSGILCPYELMGTCRDEDCHFVHQSARNGNTPSEVLYAAAESIPLIAAATPRDGKLSS